MKFTDIHEIHENGPPESTLLPWPSQNGDFDDFLHFFWEIPTFLQKSWISTKIYFTKAGKQKIMQKYTFATPGSARRGAISQFSSNYGEIHQIPPIIGEFLLISPF